MSKPVFHSKAALYVVIDSLFIAVHIFAGFMYLVFVLLRSIMVIFLFCNHLLGKDSVCYFTLIVTLMLYGY